MAAKAFAEAVDADRAPVVGDTEHDAEVATDLNIDCFLVSYGHCTYKRLKQTGFPVFRSVPKLESAIQKHL